MLMVNVCRVGKGKGEALSLAGAVGRAGMVVGRVRAPDGLLHPLGASQYCLNGSAFGATANTLLQLLPANRTQPA